ncbi:hypothetical protein [Streptomyces sp. NPDC101165]
MQDYPRRTRRRYLAGGATAVAEDCSDKAARRMPLFVASWSASPFSC